MLQRNIVADVSVVLSSFSVSLENLVTCRFINLASSVRRRAFDTKLSATLDGIYIEDHVRSSPSSDDEKTFLLRGEANKRDDKMKEQKEDGTFSSLEVDIYEVLSPDYPTARADMIVKYVYIIHLFIITHTHMQNKQQQTLKHTVTHRDILCGKSIVRQLRKY